MRNYLSPPFLGAGTEIAHPCGGSSVEKESLSTHEDADLFLGLVKLQTGDTSIVENTGTFLLWYDMCSNRVDFSARYRQTAQFAR
jgi:hypothetical protein